MIPPSLRGFDGPRDYWDEVTAEDRDSIVHLITELSERGLVGLWGMGDVLELMGEETRHVNRLSFLAIVLEDEDLYGRMQTIRDRSMGIVWGTFWPRTCGGLDRDAPVPEDVIVDFSARCHHPGNELLAQSLREQDWDTMIQIVLN